MIPGIVAIITKIKAFFDNFNRADNSSTLTASGTRSWLNWNGTWGIASNRASTSTTASNYPAAVVKTGTEYARIKVAGTGGIGWGTLFWGNSASSWYGTWSDRTTYQTGPFTGYSCPTYPYICGGGTECGDVNCVGGNGCNTKVHECPVAVPATPVLGQCPDGSYSWECGGYQCSGGSISGPCQNSCGGGCYWGNNCNNAYCSHNNFIAAVPFTYYVDNYIYWLRTIRWNGGVSTLSSTQIVNTTNSGRYFQSIQVSTDTPTAGTVRISHRIDGEGSDSTLDVAIASPVKGKHYGMFLAPPASGGATSTVDDVDYQSL